MIQSEGRFLRQHQGKSYAARVWIEVDTAPPMPYVMVDCRGTGWGGSQGDLDDVSATGYEDWKVGACQGASFALGVASCVDVGVTIVRILGSIVDTNPVVVAAAAADAVWKALSFEPSGRLRKSLESLVFQSWDLPEPDNTVLDLNNLVRDRDVP